MNYSESPKKAGKKEISKSSYKEMRSDSKNKTLDKGKLNKSSIDFLKKSPLLTSYLSRRRNPGAKRGPPPQPKGAAFHKTVLSIMELSKARDARSFQKSTALAGRALTRALQSAFGFGAGKASGRAFPFGFAGTPPAAALPLSADLLRPATPGTPQSNRSEHAGDFAVDSDGEAPVFDAQAAPEQRLHPESVPRLRRHEEVLDFLFLRAAEAVSPARGQA